MSAPIRLHALTVAYRAQPALERVSGEFAEGSLTAVVGPNGAGKSSLLAAITGQVPLAGGEVRLAPGLREALACLPQRSELDRSFPLRVLDVVLQGAWRRSGAFGRLGAALCDEAEAALVTVGLGGLGARLIGELSAGQFQRVMFARLLLQDARVILLDEPFTAIDERTTADLLALVRRWHREGRTVVAVLHDLAQVRAHFPETLLLAREAVAWGPTGAALSAENLARARMRAIGWADAPCAAEHAA